MAVTKETYTEAVGRRKTAVARVRLIPASKTTFVINERELASYFPTNELQAIVKAALTLGGGDYTVTAKIVGGGIAAQAEAMRHGIARALTKVNADLRKPLKEIGYLKRDPRSVERKKPGLRKARRAPQWSKR